MSINLIRWEKVYKNEIMRMSLCKYWRIDKIFIFITKKYIKYLRCENLQKNQQIFKSTKIIKINILINIFINN
jgi:hypothetical protein